MKKIKLKIKLKKYKIYDLFKIVLFILKTGISYRNIYVIDIKNSTKYLNTYTSFILNKYSIDDVTYNLQIKKHKNIKI